MNFTIIIRNNGSSLDTQLNLTDVLPAGLSYIPGTLEATLGNVDDSNSSQLHWTGVLGSTSEVTISYETIATVPQGELRIIENTATLSGADIASIVMRASVIVNGKNVFLPTILR